ncbi:hypothetical protein CP969_01475 [Streptomyces viridosporus T7A]|uniref:Uncharacterized protein n=1 Tax=Streptomyces viridosporus T7A TaxID=665577 RepID=A0ABX6A7B3_STRVD|nr:hypothetical protein CP969_01475 [Streptomyces viridosporus T7A]
MGVGEGGGGVPGGAPGPGRAPGRVAGTSMRMSRGRWLRSLPAAAFVNGFWALSQILGSERGG